MLFQEVTYRYFDFFISSDVPLDELPARPLAPHRFRIQSASMPEVPAPMEWDWEWRLPSEEIFLSVARTDEGYILQYPDLLTVQFLADERTLHVLPNPSVAGATIRHLLIDHVLPRLVSHEGGMVLHAAAVAEEDGVVLFLGQTGAGKSTLSASFQAEGHELLTDDCLLLDPTEGGYVAIPAYPGLRLWPDSAALFMSADRAGEVSDSWKTRLDVAPGQGSSRPVRALFLLEVPEAATGEQGVEVSAIRGGEALTELLKHGFVLDPSDRQTIERHFQATGRLAGALPLFRVRYPREFSKLSTVREAIQSTLRDLRGR